MIPGMSIIIKTTEEIVHAPVNTEKHKQKRTGHREQINVV
jgi:hypothetical protein